MCAYYRRLLLRLVLILGVGIASVPLAPWPVHAEPENDRNPAAAGSDLIPFVSGLSEPVFMTHAGDNSGRLFVVERGGIIKVINSSGQILPTPFLNVQNLITSVGSEQGLLGLAFHPAYASNGIFFIYYTAPDGANTLARLTVSADPNVANSNSLAPLFSIPDSLENHNGGMLAFGPDDYLYVGLGDGGGGGDPLGSGQSLTTLLGKILRLDVNNPAPGLLYGIPPTNPFANSPSARKEIWAYGVRNPWKFSFDRSNGDLYIGDVGQGDWEEIDFQPAGSAGGQNYGWNITEGIHCYPPGSNCSMNGITLPITEYGHSLGDCSVSGGYVYRGTASPLLVGSYIYGDFCTGRVWLARRDLQGHWYVTPFLDTTERISAFAEDQAGEVYLVSLNGSISRLALNPASPPRPTTTGVFRPSNGLIFTKNQNTTGVADTTIVYGIPNDVPLAGDWDGNGLDSAGVFRNGAFLLRNSNATGFAEIGFGFGISSDIPVVGDWNGDGIDTVGVYRNGAFFLRNSNSTGAPDLQFAFGRTGDIPVGGDWNNDGTESIGVYRPSVGVFFLRNTNTGGFADIQIIYGLPTDKPIVGDWNADGVDTIGVYRDGLFLLRNTNSTGGVDVSFNLGVTGDVPISGDWDYVP